MNKFDKVLVLLATYNGIKWIDQQVQSIVKQVNVDIDLVVSDDFSSDGTENYLKNSPYIKLLPR